MGLNEIERQILVDLRMQKAKDTINEIDILMANNLYRTATNRLYYACYYAVIALLLKDKHEATTHNGVITQFSYFYVKENRVSKEMGKLYRSLFEMRLTGDYDDDKVIDREDLQDKIEPAKLFILTIDNLINL
jgi:uncharacterized protein (UPF0332 family)